MWVGGAGTLIVLGSWAGELWDRPWTGVKPDGRPKVPSELPSRLWLGLVWGGCQKDGGRLRCLRGLEFVASDESLSTRNSSSMFLSESGETICSAARVDPGWAMAESPHTPATIYAVPAPLPASMPRTVVDRIVTHSKIQKFSCVKLKIWRVDTSKVWCENDLIYISLTTTLTLESA